MTQIISVIFFTAYFLKGQNMGSVKKTNKTGNLANMLSEQKSFEVIKNSSVRFKDVAGLDQSKVEIQ